MFDDEGAVAEEGKGNPLVVRDGLDAVRTRSWRSQTRTAASRTVPTRRKRGATSFFGLIGVLMGPCFVEILNILCDFGVLV